MKYTEIDSKYLYLPPNHSKSRCQSGELATLARSIARLGVLSPLCVKPLIGGGGYEIIEGKRRFCAAKLAGKQRMPCMVLEKGENPWLVKLTLSKFNSHDPFELADNLKKAFICSERSAEEFADSMGMELSEFIQFLMPTSMTPIEREIAQKNLISADRIRKISSLPSRKDRLNALTKYIQPTEKDNKTTSKPLKKDIKVRRRASISGLGFFENTLRRSLEVMENAGFHTENHAEEGCGEIKYTIRLKNASKV